MLDLSTECHPAGVTWWQWLLIATGITLAVYGAVIAWLLLAGRRQDARAIAGLTPTACCFFGAYSRTPASRDAASSCSAQSSPTSPCPST